MAPSVRPGRSPTAVHPEQFAVFAGVLPEDKYKLVKAFQKGGHTVGMCGDGANDAPALRQAQIGIAVSTATDVAKSAAGMVLTEPGLAGIVAAVKEGRVTFQRIQTYTLNSIIKKIVTVLFLIVGLIMTGHAILTPLLMVIVMITGDFLAMSLTTDNVRPSPMPNAWRIGSLTMAGVIMGICLLAFCSGVLAVGKFEMGLGIEALRTLAFVALVFGSQATIYAIRERRHLWGSRPSLWLAVSSVADILIASTLAIGGIAMTPLPALDRAGTLAAAAAFAFVVGSREGSGFAVSGSPRTAPRCRKDEDENQFKGLSRAGRRRGQSQKVADEGRSRVQVEGAIQKASGRTRRATEFATAASLRVQSLCRPADLPGHGCGGKRRRHQARDVRGQSPGLPGVQLQASQRRRIGTRFSLAHHPRSAGTRADRHLQPILLRGGADRPRAPGDSAQRRAPGHAASTMKTVWHDRYRSIANLERHLHANGTRIIKFFLHLSKEEQRKRFLARIDEPEKNWKFSAADIAERKFWKQLHEGL